MTLIGVVTPLAHTEVDRRKVSRAEPEIQSTRGTIMAHIIPTKTLPADWFIIRD
jgi:hypothetical protein